LALLAVAGGWPTIALLVAAFIGVGGWEWTRMCRDRSAWLVPGWLVLLIAGAAVTWIGRDQGPGIVLFLFGAVWATDIGAYAAGSALRGPRIAPSISPNKTWAGLAGGMILAVIWSLIWAELYRIEVDYLLEMAVIGAAAAIVAQAGDFALSFAKRRCGVKDSSGLIPGHGGVLDRIAGLLTTGPALALLLLSANGNI
jgi:phosphatidate cytidylyltransferase